MIFFRPNDDIPRYLLMRRAKSIGRDIEEISVDEVDDRLIGRVLEVEYGWCNR